MKRTLLIAACLMVAVAAWSQEEREYQKWMQSAMATVGSLNKNLEAKNKGAAADDARKLQGVFDHVCGFWTKKNVADAIKFAMSAHDGFEKIAQQASAGEFEKASATFKETTANCGNCHSAHREKAGDGSFKIKY